MLEVSVPLCLMRIDSCDFSGPEEVVGGIGGLG
jgi:hypothetical protein